MKNKKEKEEKENQSKKSATGDCVVESESDGDVLVVTMSLATTSGKEVDDDWVLDSSCTYYMCAHRDWFVTYEPVDTGIVLMGNDTESKVVGIGTVQIKTRDAVVKTLSKVRHLPNMTRNLISLSTLEANGCTYSVENGVLKMMKVAMVLMKGLMQGSLYILHGTTVTDSVAVCTTSADIDTTKLWHMRLGRMSEKGITILSKKGCLGNRRRLVSLQLNTVPK